jgi:cellobiose-specific phosphotransferase system component IIC
VVIAFAWFIMSQYLASVQAAGRAIADAVGSSDSNYIAADQFITALIMGFLALAIFALAIWVYNYNQRQAATGGM